MVYKIGDKVVVKECTVTETFCKHLIGKIGTIVLLPTNRNGYYGVDFGVDFGKEYAGLHTLDGILEHSTGLYLTRESIELYYTKKGNRYYK